MYVYMCERKREKERQRYKNIMFKSQKYIHFTNRKKMERIIILDIYGNKIFKRTKAKLSFFHFLKFY